MNENTTNPVADVDFQFSWEGPAEHAPGVLREVANGQMPFDVAELAGWVAVTAIFGAVGNLAYEPIKANVRSVLAALRGRQGQDKLVELKQRVTAEMMTHRPNGKLTERELQQRIDAFFDEIQG
jgi:hypothetical protein